jgi:hypothetical protein
MHTYMICINIHTFIHICYVHISTYIYMCVYTYTLLSIYAMYKYLHIYIYICVYMHTDIYIYICIYVCIYAYIYIYIHTKITNIRITYNMEIYLWWKSSPPWSRLVPLDIDYEKDIEACSDLRYLGVNI